MGVFLGREYRLNEDVSKLITDFDVLELNQFERLPSSIEELAYLCIKQPIKMVFLLKELNHIEESNSLAFQQDNFLVDKVAKRLNLLHQIIYETEWISNPEAVWCNLQQLSSLSYDKILVVLGDVYFDQEEFKRAYIYYSKACKVYALENSEKLIDYTKILGNMSIIHCMIGDVDKGIELLEYAFKLYPCNKVLITMLRCKLEYTLIPPSSVMDNYISQLLVDRDDAVLGFLVWFFHENSDNEESITSYLHIESESYKVIYLHYYVDYMLKSNQAIAMKHFLEPIIANYPIHYHRVLVKSYIELNAFEEAFQAMDVLDYHYSEYELAHKKITSDGKVFAEELNVDKLVDIDIPYISYSSILLLKSILSYKLNQVIRAINYVNQIELKDLTSIERMEYHLHVALLSKRSHQGAKEHIQYEEIVTYLQEKYRQIYLGIQANQRKDY